MGVARPNIKTSIDIYKGTKYSDIPFLNPQDW